MSWKKFKKFTRTSDLIDYDQYWVYNFAKNSFCLKDHYQYSYSWQEYEDDFGWWKEYHYPRYGVPQNMGELYQLRLLTLLHRINIINAKQELADRGWL